MSHLTNDTASINAITVPESVTLVERTPASVKDAGRVKVGGVNIRYHSAAASTKDAGRVKVGGVNIRYHSAAASTKDAGRVKVGGVNIRF